MTGGRRATPVLLWSRAALLAAVVVVASTVAHVSADGLLPGLPALALLLAGTTVVAARFLTRRASALRIVALLAGGQALIHGVLTLLAGHREATGHATAHPMQAIHPVRPVVVGEGRSGSFFDQMSSASPAPRLTPADGSGALGHLWDHLAVQSPWMVLAHVAAVVLLGVWLAVGEHALWTVVSLTTSRLVEGVARTRRAVLGGWPVLHLERVRRTLSLASTARSAVPLPQLLHHVVAHRGPPVLLAA